MAIEVVPEWMENLEDEDIAFIKKFILASGSLKEIANQYSVTYPTVRLRLDKLIQKIKISEDTTNDPYVALIKRLAVNDKIDFDTAKILISEYRKFGKENSNGWLGTMLLSMLPALILMNIPTIIFIAIYIACREQYKKSDELKKMNIQDLEWEKTKEIPS